MKSRDFLLLLFCTNFLAVKIQEAASCFYLMYGIISIIMVIMIDAGGKNVKNNFGNKSQAKSRTSDE